MMNGEEREEAIFGAFDGVVSIIGFIFGLLIHGCPESAIAIGGLGGAIAAGVSMGTGEFEKDDGPFHKRLRLGVTMFVATLIGSVIPVWPFFFFSKPVALLATAVGCVAAATWIGYAKRQGRKGYLMAYATLFLAAGITLGVISLIPQSVG